MDRRGWGGRVWLYQGDRAKKYMEPRMADGMIEFKDTVMPVLRKKKKLDYNCKNKCRGLNEGIT